MGGNGDFTEIRSNRKVKPPNWLGSVPYFGKWYFLFDVKKTNSKWSTKAQIDSKGGDRIGWRLRREKRQVKR